MITVSGLTKQYGTRTVVDDVSFTLEPGTVTGFLGPNGAGKTTTMRMITGLVPASAGSALVDGRPYAALPNPGSVMGTLLDAGAFKVAKNGTFSVDTAKVKEAVKDLTAELMTLQASGERSKAAELLKTRAVIRPEVQRVLDRLARVPVDIEPRFVTAEKLLREVERSR